MKSTLKTQLPLSKSGGVLVHVGITSIILKPISTDVVSIYALYFQYYVNYKCDMYG